jgi:hypothetical protein
VHPCVQLPGSEWLANAIHDIDAQQPELWSWNVGERTRVAEIFLRLRETDPFPGRLQVDTEWNREGRLGNPKQLTPNTNNTGTPDIVLHRRGFSSISDNLLVAEFKNFVPGTATSVSDQEKVELWTTRFSYQLGAVISLGPSGKVFDPAARWLSLQTDGSIRDSAWFP